MSEQPVVPRARTRAGRLARLGAVVAVCALAAACGGSDKPEQELSQVDQARAERINFVAADFPAGWSKAATVGEAGQGGSDAVDRTIEDCLSQGQAASPVTADAGSGGFALGALHVSSHVTFSRSPALARSDLASLKTPRATFCFKQAIETATRELEPVPTSVDQTTTTLFLGDVRVDPLPMGVRYGDDAIALRATAVLRTIRGENVLVHSDLVVFVRGRAMVSASFVSSPTPFPADLEQTLMTKIAARA